MTQHTPGPWRVSYARMRQVVADNGAIIATCNKLNGLVNLQANARLIASVTDLLDIVTSLANISEGLANGNSSAEAEAFRLSERGRIVITKVKGTAP